MNDINISEIFCEVLSGAVLLIVIGLGFYFGGVLPVEFALQMMNGSISFGGVAAIVVICYMLGLIMDSIGLAVGDLFLDNLLNPIKSEEGECEQFFQTVPAHVLKYSDTQWAYYSTYRNLLILLIPGGIFAICIVWQKGFIATVLVILIVLFLGAALWRSMVALLNIYFRLFKVKYKQK